MRLYFPDKSTIDALRRIWTDRYVRVKPGVRADLLRFEGKVGRVITINYNGKAVVDFADGAWYDIGSFETVLEFLSVDDALKTDYDTTANSAQPHPTRQS